MTHLAYYLASDIPALAKKSGMDNKLAELNTVLFDMRPDNACIHKIKLYLVRFKL